MHYFIAIFFPFVSLFKLGKYYLSYFSATVYFFIWIFYFQNVNVGLLSSIYLLLVIWSFFEIYTDIMKNSFEDFLLSYLTKNKSKEKIEQNIKAFSKNTNRVRKKVERNYPKKEEIKQYANNTDVFSDLKFQHSEDPVIENINYTNQMDNNDYYVDQYEFNENEDIDSFQEDQNNNKSYYNEVKTNNNDSLYKAYMVDDIKKTYPKYSNPNYKNSSSYRTSGTKIMPSTGYDLQNNSKYNNELSFRNQFINKHKTKNITKNNFYNYYK